MTKTLEQIAEENRLLQEELLKERQNVLNLEIELSGYRRKERFESSSLDQDNISLENIIDIELLQSLQDRFAHAHGVASIITYTDGTPITKPSNFTRLCQDLVRNTPKGQANCYISDSIIGKFNPDGPTIKICMSGGLWDAGAAISIGGKHIANWLIGQVRNEEQTEENIINYAVEIGADPEIVKEAFYEVPSMSLEKFTNISNFLFILANLISNTAYQTIYQSKIIKKLKIAEKEKKNTAKKYSQLLKLLPQTVWETDLNGNFTYINNNGFKKFGYSRSDLKKLNISDVIAPEDLKKAQTNFMKNLQGLSTQSNEYICVTKDGIRFPALIYASPTIESGTPVGLTGITIDNSEQVKAEEERRGLEEELHRAKTMEALGILAGGVAHDLNNVLSGIVSVPELLLLEIEDEKQRGLINLMKDSGKKATYIVQELLTIARMNVATKEVMNLNDYVNKYLSSNECHTTLEFHKNSKITTSLDEELLNIIASPIHIEKTIMNLINNATEAQNNGGDIVISTENITIDRLVKGHNNIPEGDYALLKITDNGIGIEEEDIDKIFQPFYTKKKMGRSGTGLGMTIVYETVKEHNGHIDIKSQIGNGTTFFLYFPATRETIKDKGTEASVYLTGNKETVLIVDDNEQQRKIASLILEKLNYLPYQASSGEEAIEYIKKTDFDLILLDMIMEPGINGKETYEIIKKITPTQKAIIASGFSKTDDVKATLKLGAGTYIKKPYTIDKIAYAVKKELEK